MNNIFFVIKGQFAVMDYIPNTIILFSIVHCIYVLCLFYCITCMRQCLTPPVTGLRCIVFNKVMFCSVLPKLFPRYRSLILIFRFGKDSGIGNSRTILVNLYLHVVPCFHNIYISLKLIIRFYHTLLFGGNKVYLSIYLFTIASAMVIYVSKLPLGACSIRACSISKLRNGSGVNSPAAVSFTDLPQTPRRPSYFLWIPDCF